MCPLAWARWLRIIDRKIPAFPIAKNQNPASEGVPRRSAAMARAGPFGGQGLPTSDSSARTLVQPFVRCAPGSSCFAGLWICLPRGKAAGDEIVDKDAAGDDSDPKR